MAQEHLSPHLVKTVFSAIPGSSALVNAHRPAHKPASGIEAMMSGAMRNVLGVSDPLATALGELKAAGLSSAQALQAGLVFLAFIREKAGQDVVKQMADEIPGLSRLH